MITHVAQAQAAALSGGRSPTAVSRRPRTWQSLLPRRTRASLCLVLEDAIIDAQDCADEAAERECLALLATLEPPAPRQALEAWRSLALPEG
jgi:hypothetical protein